MSKRRVFFYARAVTRLPTHVCVTETVTSCVLLMPTGSTLKKRHAGPACVASSALVRTFVSALKADCHLTQLSHL